jgi:hypothetical protein
VSDLLPGDLELELGELLDRLREERDSAERAKEAARAARPGEEIAAPSAATPESPDARAAATRHELRRRLELIRAAAAEAHAAIDRAVTDAIAAAEAAVLAPSDELERLKRENDELRARPGAQAEPKRPRQRGTRAPAGEEPVGDEG